MSWRKTVIEVVSAVDKGAYRTVRATPALSTILLLTVSLLLSVLPGLSDPHWYLELVHNDPALHYSALQRTALHCPALHCTVLHCPALHCTVLHCTLLHITELQFRALQCTAMQCTAVHCNAVHCTEISPRCTTISCTVHYLSAVYCVFSGAHHPSNDTIRRTAWAYIWTEHWEVTKVYIQFFSS